MADASIASSPSALVRTEQGKNANLDLHHGLRGMQAEFPKGFRERVFDAIAPFRASFSINTGEVIVLVAENLTDKIRKVVGSDEIDFQFRYTRTISFERYDFCSHPITIGAKSIALVPNFNSPESERAAQAPGIRMR